MEYNKKLAKRTIKDSVFTDLFRIKKNLLELYKTLHPEDTDIKEEDISNVTIENILTNTFYNDLGFCVKQRQIILMEAQSTWTLNILVRILIYLAQTYAKHLEETEQSVYNKKKVTMPYPELYVLYTGNENKRPKYLSLAEEFFDGNKEFIDIRVKVLYGGNEDDRDIITQYVMFTKICDEQIKKHGRTREAIIETIKICRDKGVLEEYLKNRKEEVENMMFTLFDEEKIMEMYLKSEVKDAVKDAVEDAVKDTEIRKSVKFVDNLIEKKGFELEEACEMAGITIEQYREYKDMLCVK